MLKVGETTFATTDLNDASLLIRSAAKVGGNIVIDTEEFDIKPGANYKVASEILNLIGEINDSETAQYDANGMVITCSVLNLKNAAQSIAASMSDEDEDVAFQNELRQKLQDISVAIAAVTTLIINV